MKELKIPGTLNTLIFFCAGTAGLSCQWMASHDGRWWVMLLSAMGFAYFNNTLFSLLHESVHGNFHPNEKMNKFFGILCAAFFPTGYHFQKICHIGHHFRNRTDAEMFETYNDGDNKFLKNALLYHILTGLFWITSPIGAFWYLLSPKNLLNSFWRSKGNYKVKRLGAEDMLAPFEKLLPPQVLRIRLEILYTLCFQVAVFYFLDLKFGPFILCYYFFAFQWSGLQYADHAYSARDVRLGAWNLKVNPLTRYLFLNYHYHLVHHQYPQIPWIHLGKYVEKTGALISFWSIYLRMWKGVIKVDRVEAKGPDHELQKVLNAQSIVSCKE